MGKLKSKPTSCSPALSARLLDSLLLLFEDGLACCNSSVSVSIGKGDDTEQGVVGGGSQQCLQLSAKQKYRSNLTIITE